MNNIVLLLVFFALIYFMMIRPQQKQQKKRKQMLEGLSKGDKVVTIGGIYGKIKTLQDENVKIEVANGVTIKVLKTAIGQVVSEDDTNEVKELESNKQEAVEENEADE